MTIQDLIRLARAINVKPSRVILRDNNGRELTAIHMDLDPERINGAICDLMFSPGSIAETKRREP